MKCWKNLFKIKNNAYHAKVKIRKLSSYDSMIKMILTVLRESVKLVPMFCYCIVA